MAAKEPIVCHVCGFKNPPDTARCSSCGARVEALSVEYTAEEAAARADQQDTFSVVWVLVTVGIFLALQGVVIGLLPMVISAYDPQGPAGLFISILLWFVGGILSGFFSPGKTFFEPAAAAIIAAVPTVLYLKWVTPDGFEPTLVAYIVGSAMGIMLALFGAFLGERLQRRTRGHATKR